MLPEARLVHHIEGRTRLRLPALVRDAAALERLARRVAQHEGVEQIRVNPLTGSMLLVHRLDPDDLAELGEAEELFRLVRKAPDPRPSSTRLSRALDDSVGWLDRWLHAASRHEVDLDTVTFLGLVAAAAWQAFNGKALPAGVTLMNYAFKVLRGGAGIGDRER